ncbi:hypothetical protein [Salinadaptatus halalkaliphilus]|nr:hypothetical protein [Salinadaptatus halalkaliphilus]
MPIDRWHTRVGAVLAQWHALERDWQSVVVGAVIVALIVAFEIRIPW